METENYTDMWQQLYSYHTQHLHLQHFVLYDTLMWLN